MPKQKVAIIGAGPSGFAVAEVLRSEKYRQQFDFKIYERNGYVGGKCLTVTKSGQVCNGKPGGYEVGAVLISKHTESYKQLSKLLIKYDLTTTTFNRNDQRIATYIKKRAEIDANKLGYQKLTRLPSLFRGLRGFEDYIVDYIRYDHSMHAGYAGRPNKLNKRLSKLYSKQVNERMAGVMQGFGYADLDDRHLTPPALYYHQYVEAGALTHALETVDTGTQGIWAKIASTYPEEIIRLNTPVLKIKRSAEKVEVITEGGKETYDYLAVATPLKPALAYLDINSKDRQFMAKMKHNHYVTVLCGVSNFSNLDTCTFNLDNCTNKKYLGHVLAGYKRYAGSDMVAFYLYLKPGAPIDDKSILDQVEVSLEHDFAARMVKRSEAKVFHWDDYFGHLDTRDLNRGWYEKFDNEFQGKNRTLYVSSGLHMETMGASVQYGTELATKYAEIWSK